MIYDTPGSASPIDQGDLIDGCAVVDINTLEFPSGKNVAVELEQRRVVVLTQACDLANEKTTIANVAEVFDAQLLVDKGILKAADVKGPVRAGQGMVFSAR